MWAVGGVGPGVFFSEDSKLFEMRPIGSILQGCLGVRVKGRGAEGSGQAEKQNGDKL